MPPPSYEQTIVAVAACDVLPSNIRVVYEDYLQSDVVKIRDLGTLYEAKFLCLRKAVDPYYLLEIERDDQRLAFYEVDHRESRRRSKADALEWLRTRNLLERVPLFDPKKVRVEDYMTQVEAFCGYEPESMLERYDEHMITIMRDSVSFPFSDQESAKFYCLLKTISASDIEEHGLRFGFIGNEQSSEGPP